MEWKCDICSKTFSGVISFQEHEASEKHKKKLRLSAGASCGITDAVQSQSADEYHCSICSISVSGFINYQKHANSIDHAIMVQKKEKIANPLEITKPASNGINVATQEFKPLMPIANSINTNLYYSECKLCQKHFSGPEPYNQHVISAGHIKKCMLAKNSPMQIYEIDSKMDTENLFGMGHETKLMQQNSETQEIGNSKYRCDICDKCFTGPVPYEQHINSIQHAKKMNQGVSLSSPKSTSQDIVRNDKELCTPGVEKWFCEICSKSCSGPIPYKSHIISKDHIKKIRIAEVEANIRKLRESESLLNSENIVSSTGILLPTFDYEIKEQSSGCVINNLNFGINDVDGNKGKFQKKSDDFNSVNLESLNIVGLENLDVAIIGTNEEIVFDRNIKKCNKEYTSEIMQFEENMMEEDNKTVKKY